MMQTVPHQISAIERFPTTTSDVAFRARQRLLNCPHSAVRGVQCRFHEGVLLLVGEVPTFYMKQVAQEWVRDLEHVEQVDNRLQVPK